MLTQKTGPPVLDAFFSIPVLGSVRVVSSDCFRSDVVWITNHVDGGAGDGVMAVMQKIPSWE